MKQTLNMRQQLYQFTILLFIQKIHTKYVGDPQFAHHWYKPIVRGLQLSAVCLTTLPAKMSACNSYMRQNAYYPELKSIFENLLPCNFYAMKPSSRTIRSRVSQPASVGKEADLERSSGS